MPAIDLDQRDPSGRSLKVANDARPEPAGTKVRAMEFGMFHESPWSRGQTESETFDPSFEQIDAAERCGLDVMWLAELHTVPTRSVLSAPLDVTTAIATRTSRIKIGTAVQVLPLCHPLRIAEEAATVDQISHGRLILGSAAVGSRAPFRPTVYAESQERFAETLDIIKRACLCQSQLRWLVKTVREKTCRC